MIYFCTVKESKKLLTIILKTIVKISNKLEGKRLLFYFDASLDVINVTQKVLGANKYRVSIQKILILNIVIPETLS